jgi:hypothetical protein
MIRVTPFPTFNFLLLPLPTSGGSESNISQAVGQIKEEAQVDRQSKKWSVLYNPLINKYCQHPYTPTLTVVPEVRDQVLVCCH